MDNLPRLELICDNDKKNEYIIYRHQYKCTKNRGTMNRRGTKKKRDTTKRKRDTTKRKRGKRTKGLFNIF